MCNLRQLFCYRGKFMTSCYTACNHILLRPAGVKLLETECADLEHKAHPALDKLTVRVCACTSSIFINCIVPDSSPWLSHHENLPG